MHVVERFAGWAAQYRKLPLSSEVLHHAKRAVIDWHAALFAGAVMAPATLLEKAFKDELDKGGSSLALGRKAPVRTAALINGAAAHAAEVDDIYRDGIYHPGAPTIAAALALAQDRKASGMDFLRAVVVGYEISTRIGAAMGRAHYKYWHNTGTIGCFGSAAACSEILNLEQKAFSHALATVTTFSAGLQQAFRMDSMSKPLHAGRAAEAGLTAALAAAEGVTGSLDVLEGETGYGHAMSDGPDWEKSLVTLGRNFHIAGMTFKNHACCGHAFAAIDGVLELRKRGNFSVKDIERVTVGTYKAALDVARHENPATAAEAQFSLKYVVATALTHGNVRLAAFRPERISDQETRKMMQKISVSIDRQLDATFPGQRAARVAIEARGGRREEFLQPTRKGDPDAPLSDDELDEKYLELSAPVLGEARARALLKQLWSLEKSGTLA